MSNCPCMCVCVCVWMRESEPCFKSTYWMCWELMQRENRVLWWRFVPCVSLKSKQWHTLTCGKTHIVIYFVRSCFGGKVYIFCWAEMWQIFLFKLSFNNCNYNLRLFIPVNNAGVQLSFTHYSFPVCLSVWCFDLFFNLFCCIKS